ncbi:hypothetical protein VTL71DRAFT_10597 [Oculimacula yallundae]|uniref:Uncharacterized protein n=1 Tax=Oculimacula yallundae TaxID=86028 RepID=A0ABR4CU06_9HELO
MPGRPLTSESNTPTGRTTGLLFDTRQRTGAGASTRPVQPAYQENLPLRTERREDEDGEIGFINDGLGGYGRTNGRWYGPIVPSSSPMIPRFERGARTTPAVSSNLITGGTRQNYREIRPARLVAEDRSRQAVLEGGMPRDADTLSDTSDEEEFPGLIPGSEVNLNEEMNGLWRLQSTARLQEQRNREVLQERRNQEILRGDSELPNVSMLDTPSNTTDSEEMQFVSEAENNADAERHRQRRAQEEMLLQEQRSRESSGSDGTPGHTDLDALYNLGMFEDEELLEDLGYTEEEISRIMGEYRELRERESREAGITITAGFNDIVPSPAPDAVDDETFDHPSHMLSMAQSSREIGRATAGDINPTARSSVPNTSGLSDDEMSHRLSEIDEDEYERRYIQSDNRRLWEMETANRAGLEESMNPVSDSGRNTSDDAEMPPLVPHPSTRRAELFETRRGSERRPSPDSAERRAVELDLDLSTSELRRLYYETDYGVPARPARQAEPLAQPQRPTRRARQTRPRYQATPSGPRLQRLSASTARQSSNSIAVAMQPRASDAFSRMRTTRSDDDIDEESTIEFAEIENRDESTSAVREGSYVWPNQLGIRNSFPAPSDTRTIGGTTPTQPVTETPASSYVPPFYDEITTKFISLVERYSYYVQDHCRALYALLQIYRATTPTLPLPGPIWDSLRDMGGNMLSRDISRLNLAADIYVNFMWACQVNLKELSNGEAQYSQDWRDISMMIELCAVIADERMKVEDTAWWKKIVYLHTGLFPSEILDKFREVNEQ